MLLVAIHLFLIRRYGITEPWSRTGSEGTRSVPFYPYQMARDAFAIALVLGMLIAVSSQLAAPLDHPADPGDSTFVPRPDWYFLFLFQMLRYFEGKWEWIGTFVIPFSATIVLFLLPFLDRNTRRELRFRRWSIVVLFTALSIVGWLTYAAVQETPTAIVAQRPSGISPPRATRIKRPSEVGGMFLLKQRCFQCHSMTQFGERANLQALTKNYFPSDPAWFEQHLGTAFSEKEVHEVVSVLRWIATDRTDLLIGIPRKAQFGAHFFYNSSCPMCHTIDGQGGKNPEVPSPDLTLRLLRTKEWHIKHIHDPQSVVRNSKMPPFFHYEPQEYDALAEYLLYLHSR
jgi:ubiquinol-cytochrome c reductase cytochrome b subunit